ncbi:hypothetical protein KIH86_25640 [Paenibacillus sp. HN-1]|uniref:hypothetical protein n=1 Tax=Paenibacillus TaxID=44249 RepID=UPI001CAA254C|nr:MULTISPECIES: hypothetical protein [Paenibacillus]MBY9081303.1 hypothetical protein [Paenibacillus sp. CGMCC 1.18879]MBY9087576.1 hypothetical protein [Paenibacillus sinensis]
MPSNLQPAYIWSRECVFSGKPQRNVLLVEWKGAVQQAAGGKKSQRIAARSIELRIWPEPHVSLTGLQGCRSVTRGERALVLSLGDIRAGQSKYLAFEFMLDSREPGHHETLWLQWRYSRRQGERCRELPVQKLTLEYSRHTGYLNAAASFYVEKQLELLRTDEMIAKASDLYVSGRRGEAKELLRRHGDKLLLLGIRSGDNELAREAQSLYMQSDREMFLEREENKKQDCRVKDERPVGKYS